MSWNSVVRADISSAAPVTSTSSRSMTRGSSARYQFGS